MTCDINKASYIILNYTPLADNLDCDPDYIFAIFHTFNDFIAKYDINNRLKSINGKRVYQALPILNNILYSLSQDCQIHVNVHEIYPDAYDNEYCVVEFGFKGLTADGKHMPDEHRFICFIELFHEIIETVKHYPLHYIYY
jgi:hypothetical protein